MSEQPLTPVYTKAEDEKVSQVMFYTSFSLCWGEVITKELIRVSTWLRTNAAPDNILLWNARVLPIQNSSAVKPVFYPEIHLPINTILVYHLLPPAQDPLDYDSRDGMRRLEPVTALVGPYRFDGKLLIAQKSNLTKYIEISKETFSSLYDVEISYPMMTSMGKLKVPFLLFRFSEALLSAKKPGEVSA
jgi:hypothetical protein